MQKMIVLLFTVLIAIVEPNPILPIPTETPIPRSLVSWMSELPACRKEEPITKLKIPGSHDSGAVNLRTDLHLAYDQNFDSLARFVLEMYKANVKNWSETQSLTPLEQLNQGIRYLDVRIEFAKLNESNQKTPMLVHGLYGAPAKSLFEDVKTFLDSNPSEIVILDINHIYNFTAAEFYGTVVNEITETVGPDCICPSSWDLSKVSYNLLIAKGYRLIIIGPYKEVRDRFLQSQLAIRSKWPKLNKIEQLSGFLASEIKNRPLDPTVLHVLQGVITVEADYIFNHLNGTLKNMISIPATAVTVETVTCFSDSDKENVNIVIADQVTSNFVKTIVRLNF